MLRFVGRRIDRGETPDPYPIAQVGATPRSRHLLNSDGGSIPDSRLLATRGEYTSLCVHALVHHPDRGVGEGATRRGVGPREGGSPPPVIVALMIRQSDPRP